VAKTNRERAVQEVCPGRLRCAIYTRKSTEEGLEQEFSSLDAQREAAEAFIESQRRESWIALPEIFDDGGFTGPTWTARSEKAAARSRHENWIASWFIKWTA
jgi:hypothetical protein